MKSQRGFTLVELLIALVVVLGILFIVAVSARSAFQDANGKKVTNVVLVLDGRIREAYAQRFDHWDLTNDSAIKEGIVPPEWVTPGTTTIQPSTGLLISLQPSTGTYAGSRYRMTVNGFIEPGSCSSIIRTVTPGVLSLSVKQHGTGTTIPVSTARGTVPSGSALATACYRGIDQIVLENA